MIFLVILYIITNLMRINEFTGLAEEIKYRFSMKRLDMLKRNIKA